MRINTRATPDRGGAEASPRPRGFRARLALHFSLVFLVVMAVIEWVGIAGLPFGIYEGRRRQHEAEAYAGLSLIADLKRDRIERWVQERRSESRMLAGSGLLVRSVSALGAEVARQRARTEQGEISWARLRETAAWRDLAGQLRELKSSKRVFREILVADADTGIVTASTNPDSLGREVAGEAYFSDALGFFEPRISPVSLEPEGENPVFRVSHAIGSVDSTGSRCDSDGCERVGVLVLVVGTEDILRPLLHTGNGLGQTGEAVLVNQDAAILTSLKYPLSDGKKPLPLRYRIRAKPALLAAAGQEGLIDALDYRGEPILGAYRHVRATPEWGWGLVVKRDKAELFAPLRRDALYSGLLALGGILIVVVLANSTALSLARPVQDLIRTAERVANGDLSARGQISGTPDMKRLIGTFNDMVERIRNAREQLEQAIRSRTAELHRTNESLRAEIFHREHAEAERRVLQAQMQHAQKLESLGVLAGGIAHDFNNLLVPILGNTDLAREALSSGGPVDEYLEAIANAAERAGGLCQQMLAYSGKGQFVIETIDLGEMVADMMDLLSLSISKDASVRCEFEDDILPVEADPSQIRQVIMNLIGNASEALGNGPGKITIRVGSDVYDRRQLEEIQPGGGVSEGAYTYFEVTDTGCGMDDDTRSRIFDPFFTTKVTGRGLGLSAVLGIVNAHRGALQLSSMPDRGTTVRVLLPASEGDVTSQECSQGSEAMRCHGGGSVLVVDDDDRVRAVSVKMLERLGFRVVAAASGREGVGRFRDQPDEIRCVVLDMTMPEMDGMETLREIRRIRPDARVIMCSGYSEHQVISQLQDEGLVSFLQKPFRFDDLARRLEEVL